MPSFFSHIKNFNPFTRKPRSYFKYSTPPTPVVKPGVIRPDSDTSPVQLSKWHLSPSTVLLRVMNPDADLERVGGAANSNCALSGKDSEETLVEMDHRKTLIEGVGTTGSNVERSSSADSSTFHWPDFDSRGVDSQVSTPYLGSAPRIVSATDALHPEPAVFMDRIEELPTPPYPIPRLRRCPSFYIPSADSRQPTSLTSATTMYAPTSFQPSTLSTSSILVPLLFAPSLSSQPSPVTTPSLPTNPLILQVNLRSPQATLLKITTLLRHIRDAEAMNSDTMMYRIELDRVHPGGYHYVDGIYWFWRRKVEGDVEALEA